MLPANYEFSVEIRESSPADLLVKIESFSLLSKYGIRKYESREFESGGFNWKLIFCFEGDESSKEGEHVAVYLWASSPLPAESEVNVIFTFGLQNQILDNFVCFRGMSRRFNALCPKWGFRRLISKKSLMDGGNGYVVDDNCVFGGEVFVMKPGKRVVECLCLLTTPTPPYIRQFKLSSFSKLEAVCTSDHHLLSGNLRWKVIAYPKGHGSGEGSHISLFVKCIDCERFAPHQRVKADITLAIKNMIPPTYCTRQFNRWFTSSCSSWGVDEFMPISDTKKLCKLQLEPEDDCCFVGVQISVQAFVA